MTDWLTHSLTGVGRCWEMLQSTKYANLECIQTQDVVVGKCISSSLVWTLFFSPCAIFKWLIHGSCETRQCHLLSFCCFDQIQITMRQGLSRVETGSGCGKKYISFSPWYNVVWVLLIARKWPCCLQQALFDTSVIYKWLIDGKCRRNQRQGVVVGKILPGLS